VPPVTCDALVAAAALTVARGRTTMISGRELRLAGFPTCMIVRLRARLKQSASVRLAFGLLGRGGLDVLGASVAVADGVKGWTGASDKDISRRKASVYHPAEGP